MFWGHYGMFGMIDIIIPLFFLFVIVMIVVQLVRGASQWRHNNRQPQIPAPARVVTKRSLISHRHHHQNDHMHSARSTSYYVTFEYASGERVELAVSGPEYGMLAEGDEGTLTTQGTRYISFHRN